MVAPNWNNNLESFPDQDLLELIRNLPHHQYGDLIKRALLVLSRISGENVDRLDWKILTSALEDFESGFQVFYPYRHTRKITIFGSSEYSVDIFPYLVQMLLSILAMLIF